jgi:hypothetical protein
VQLGITILLLKPYEIVVLNCTSYRERALKGLMVDEPRSVEISNISRPHIYHSMNRNQQEHKFQAKMRRSLSIDGLQLIALRRIKILRRRSSDRRFIKAYSAQKRLIGTDDMHINTTRTTPNTYIHSRVHFS